MRSTSLAACVTLAALAVLATAAPAQSPTSFFFDDFSAPAGWTDDGIWAIGGAAASSGHTTACGVGDPAFDADGVPGGGVAGVAIGGNAGTALIGPQYLTSPVIPCSGPTGLSFERWLNSDYPAFMTNGIDVFDGSTWVTIWLQPNNSNVISDVFWRPIFHDVSAYANPNFRVRFWYTIGANGVYNCSSWNLDNVDVFALVPGSGPITLVSDDFSIDQGWTPGTPDWMIGAAAASSGHNYGGPDPSVDADGNTGGGVAGVVLGGNAPTAIDGKHFFTSPVYDMSGVQHLGLSFERWLNSDYTPFMQNGVDVFDGTNWVNIWITGGLPGVQDSSWTFQQFDVAAHANAAFQVRFWFEVGNANVFDVSGWNLDNFELYTLVGGHGQKPGRARLDVNGSATSNFGGSVASGQSGLYFVDVSAGPMAVSLDATAAFQPWVLLAGVPNPKATPIPPYGQLDLGTAGFGGLEVLGSGLDAGFHNLFFFTNGSGNSGITYTIPPTLSGFTYGLQAVALSPTTVIDVSNAVAVTFN